MVTRNRPPLDVCILWHMHQPLYEDPASGRPAMPWVRLHALKDYYDMVALARRHPGIQLTFNLVPVLLEQIEAAAGGSKPDPWLELARRRPEELNETDRLFILDGFFLFNRLRVFSALPRLGELHRKAFSEGGAQTWTPGEWRDLQTLFHLAWCGATLQSDPLVRRLTSKGRYFDEDEKQSLLDLQQRFLTKVIPAYREARDAGAAELTTTPYYHPIVPLLCDLASVHEATPGTQLPACAPRSPEDAREQIETGLDAFAARFGSRPAGVWPSEGSVSEETLDLLDAAGMTWTATDAEILHASLRRAGVANGHLMPTLRPYRFGNRRTAVFFRDRILADLIAFTYSSWSASAAAGDFVKRLVDIAAARPEGGRGVVAVILDGENAWEAYPENGADFLDALYGALEVEPALRTVTFSRHLAEDPEFGLAPRLSAGSWIRGDLNTWIGHPEKNRAWELLSAARGVWIEAGRPGEALRWLRAAQGSDWFWWFGDDHSSALDSTFDRLFRSMLTRVHEICGRPVPAALANPIMRHPGRRRIVDPVSPVHPVVDGKVTDYFEWLGAGSVTATPASAAMHSGSGGVKNLFFGASEAAIALRLDPLEAPFSETVRAGSIEIVLASPRADRVRLELGAGEKDFELACRRVLELAVPLSKLGLSPGDRVEFSVVLRDESDKPIALLPPEGSLILDVPVPGAGDDDWFA